MIALVALDVVIIVFTVARHQNHDLTLANVMFAYLAQIVTFASIYFFAGLTSDQTLTDVHHWKETDELSYPLVWWLCIYLSVQTQTLVGYGDLAPKFFAVRLASALQMFFGLLTHIFLVTAVLNKSAESTTQRRWLETIQMNTLEEEERRYHNRGCYKRIVHNRYVAGCRRRVRRFLLPIIVTAQVIKMAIVWNTLVKSPEGHCLPATTAGTIEFHFLVAFDLLLALLIIITTRKAAAKLDDVRLPDIIQSYVSTVVQFCFLYLTIALQTCGESGFAGIPVLPSGNVETLGKFCEIVVEFFFLSFSTLTGCGMTGDIIPISWRVQALAAIEMLAGCYYHAVIFGYTLIHLSKQKLYTL